MRKKQEANARAEADAHGSAGRHVEALACYLRAESAWSLNELHPSGNVISKDLRRLTSIIEAIGREAAALGRPVGDEPLRVALQSLSELHADKRNYKSGNRHRQDMKPEPAARETQLSAEIERMRAQVRDECRTIVDHA
jgi:hypothetical protein